jgi:hypothetical protein
MLGAVAAQQRENTPSFGRSSGRLTSRSKRQPAMANQMMVRGSVSHHHHVFFRHNHVFFHYHNRIFFASAINPFAFSPTFTLASPFIAQPLPFST